MNTSPDSAFLFPVKTLTDQGNNILVLSTYQKNIPPSTTINKIHLNKFDIFGNLVWNLEFDNNGLGNPKAFDFAVDDSGNCLLAGGLMGNPNSIPFLMKVSPGGIVVWETDSASTFTTGHYVQMILKNKLLYLRNEFGVAVFDLNGNERWSQPIVSACIAVDNSGRMLIAPYMSATQLILRHDSTGVLDISFNTGMMQTERIALDSRGNIYVFAQWSNYELAKYDSAGVYQWSTSTFPPNISFGDIGFEVLIDYSDDILVVGVSDSIFKFRPDGTRLWVRSMQGLDTYRLDAKILSSNVLAVAGTVVGPQGNDVQIAMYDLYGNRNWYATYNSNNTQEFSVSLAIDNGGVYLLEDSVSSSALLRFQHPENSMPIDYNLLCVDSVWYEPGNPLLINVRVYNGNFPHLNYPSVQIVSPAGDTISNVIKFVNFFAHLGNGPLVYQDTIIVAGITDFSNYTFVISQGFGDTSVAIGRCGVMGEIELFNNALTIYPNPVSQSLNIALEKPCPDCMLEIITIEGKVIPIGKLAIGTNYSFDISKLNSGFYILRMHQFALVKHLRFVKL